MLKSNILIALIAFLFLQGGCASPQIQNDRLNDKVKACSAGFSSGAQGALHASLNKAALSGGIDGNAIEETRSIIFSEIPENMRVQAYEDYIKCIQKDWNKG